MKTLRLMLALSALFLLPAPSVAGVKLDVSREVVVKAWGDVCGGQVDVVLRDIRPVWNGLAYRCEEVRPRAVIELDRVMVRESPFAWVCSVMAHEWGHLTGLGHSDDPESIMYELASGYFRPCVRTAKRRGLSYVKGIPLLHK